MDMDDDDTIQQVADWCFIDEPMREGMRNLFDNNFMKAKGIFQSKASL